MNNKLIKSLLLAAVVFFTGSMVSPLVLAVKYHYLFVVKFVKSFPPYAHLTLSAGDLKALELPISKSYLKSSGSKNFSKISLYVYNYGAKKNTTRFEITSSSSNYLTCGMVDPNQAIPILITLTAKTNTCYNVQVEIPVNCKGLPKLPAVLGSCQFHGSGDFMWANCQSTACP